MLKQFLIAGLFGLGAGAAVAAPPAVPAEIPSEPSVKSPPPAATSAAKPVIGKPVAAAGMKIHVDPKTGLLLKEAAPASETLLLTPELQNAMSTSHEGLVEVPSPKPGGGMMLDLKGRFQSPLMATIGPDGKIRTQHLNEPAKSDEKK
jgi:hypothetical protein